MFRKDQDASALRLALSEMLGVLQQPPTDSSPSGHDLLNALHTVLCSIEMLEMDITEPQREVFDRLEQSAKHLEQQLQAFIKSSGETRRALATKIDAALAI